MESITELRDRAEAARKRRLEAEARLLKVEASASKAEAEAIKYRNLEKSLRPGRAGGFGSSFKQDFEGLSFRGEEDHHGSYGSPKAIMQAFLQEWVFSDQSESTTKELLSKYSRKLASGYRFKMEDASEALKSVLGKYQEKESK